MLLSIIVAAKILNGLLFMNSIYVATNLPEDLTIKSVLSIDYVGVAVYFVFG